MPNVFAGSATDLTFYLESPVGVPANAAVGATVSLVWKIGTRGEETTETAYRNDETGTYVFTVTPYVFTWTPGEGGMLYYEFRCTDPEYIERGQVAVQGSVFCE